MCFVCLDLNVRVCVCRLCAFRYEYVVFRCWEVAVVAFPVVLRKHGVYVN